ncbi:MAG: D-alanyl-D-alanine carboxypeptidase [Acetobacter sp.]|nr:D-alanyl-D-alanine carboxypeptidase [Acetobacter sp.]
MINRKFLLSATTCLVCAASVAGAIETKAKNAVLMDFETGEFFYEKNADDPMPPASMSKLMTAYLIFERLKDGRLSPDDVFIVSENAWRKGGAKTGSSTMFLKDKQRVRVKDLLRGIIVQSGNDACIVAAENIAGSEAEFAELANQKAKELGLKNSHFANATGWPNPDHKMSAKDLAVLAHHIIRDFPEYYSIYSEQSFTFNGIRQENRNPLLMLMPGIADGIKTGHTSVSGFGLTGSAKKNGRRLIMVVNGLKTMKERGDESLRLMNWGFREFSNYAVLKENVKVVSVPVWLGETKSVSAVPAKGLTLTLPKGRQKDIVAHLKYKTPLKAPVKKGQEIASLVLSAPEHADTVIPLYAERDVKRLGYFGRLKETVKHVLFSFGADAAKQ